MGPYRALLERTRFWGMVKRNSVLDTLFIAP